MKTTITYIFILLFFIVIPFNSFSQCEVIVTDTFVCHFSDRLDISPEVNGSKITDSYRIEAIAYDFIDPVNSVNILLGDDDITDSIDMGFEFEFFGEVYSHFYVGSNGWVSFSSNQSLSFLSSPLPSSDDLVPTNAIFGVWEDWNPDFSGEVSYQIFELEDSKKLVVTFNDMAHFLCGEDSLVHSTFQIILNESDHSIETHISNKSSCQSVTSVQGIHDQDGLQSFVVEGRNSTVWSAFEESVIYIPSNTQSFNWSINDTYLSDSSVFSHNYFLTEEVTLSFSDFVDCSQDVVFNVTVLPELELNTNRVEDYLYSEVSNLNYGYQWHLGDVLLEGETSDSVELVDYGVYILEIYKPETGCSYFSRSHLYTIISTEEFFNDDVLQMYPNPARDRVRFAFNTQEKLYVNVFNVQGQKLFSFDNTVNDIKSFDFESGLFLIQLTNEKGRSLVKKLIVN